MQHIRDLPVTKSAPAAMSRRALLFALIHQQRRAAHVRSLSNEGQVTQGDAGLDTIRRQAVRSFARPD